MEGVRLKHFTVEEKVKILSDIIAIKSINENEIEVANYLKDLFNETGLSLQLFPLQTLVLT